MSNLKDIEHEIIKLSPLFKLENPPPALFASGGEEYVDLFGNLTLVACKKPNELVVFDPLEERRSQGIFDTDARSQIEDIKVLGGKMDTDDPLVLKERIIEVFNYIENKKLFFYGTLELEANAFETNLFIDGIDPKIINKLEVIHRTFRDGKTFPKIEKSGMFTKKIKFRFIGRNIDVLWPKLKKITFKDFIVNLNSVKGNAAGIVVVSGDNAEFIILADTLRDKNPKLDPVATKLLLDDLKSYRKVPICWFNWQFGLHSLLSIWGYENIMHDQDIQVLIEQYNNRIGKLVLDYFEHEEKKVIPFEKIKSEDKKVILSELKDALNILDEMYKETIGKES
ncbi:MAG: hypothetical protein ACTSRA_02965 [Promethearchaeota archaeon]